VYVHTNLRLIYKQKEEWLKGKSKMWDVFSDDKGLNNSVELALANLDLNELVLAPITFDDGDPLEGSSFRFHIKKCTNCIGYVVYPFTTRFTQTSQLTIHYMDLKTNAFNQN
jgi:hypothetical protein